MMNNRNGQHPDIHVLPGNSKGHDKIIGDVHGGLSTFKLWLDGLGKNDRGFCVGDLVDRGEDSAGVVAAIIAHNQDPNKGSVRVVRGNHEAITLNCINELENDITKLIGTMKLVATWESPYIDIREVEAHKPWVNLYNNYVNDYPALEDLYNVSLESVVTNSTLLNGVANGGGWLINLFTEELSNGLIHFDARRNNVTYDEDSQVYIIKQYMQALPTIIHVEGNNPFNLVHADMPFNDIELQLRLKRNILMTDEEKTYAIWAREMKEDQNSSDIYIRDNGRTNASIPTAVGHNIVGGAATSALREDTNTIDLDVCSFMHKAILSINMSEGTSSWVGDNITKHPDEFYNTEVALVDEHLHMQMNVNKLVTKMRTCDSFSKLEELVSHYAEDSEQADSLMLLAFNHQVLSDEIIKRECQNGNLGAMLNWGLSANYTYNDGSCILQDAINEHRVQDVFQLLECGEDPNLPFNDGKTPLLAADMTGREDVVKPVLQALLHHAILRSEIDIVTLLVEAGADLLAVRLDNLTPLDFAVASGCYNDVVPLLLIAPNPDSVSACINFEALPDYGVNVLHVAALLGLKDDFHANSKKIDLNQVATFQPNLFNLLMSKAGVPKEVIEAITVKNITKDGMVAITAKEIGKVTGIMIERPLINSPSAPPSAAKLSSRNLFTSDRKEKEKPSVDETQKFRK
jgi:hypothetical protein